MVKRYTLSGDRMFPHSDGRWIFAEDYDSLAMKVRFLEGACTGMREENDALAARLAEALERAAAAESKEVCAVPHDDEVLEFCPYCKLEAARRDISKARRLLRRMSVAGSYIRREAEEYEFSDGMGVALLNGPWHDLLEVLDAIDAALKGQS